MYRPYINDGNYTFIEKRRRTIATKSYLSVRKPACFPTISPWKQIVSTGETNSFHGRNKQFPRWKQKHRSVIVTTQPGYCCYFPPLCRLIKSVNCLCIVASKNVGSIHKLTLCIYVSYTENVGMYREIKKNLWEKLQSVKSV